MAGEATSNKKLGVASFFDAVTFSVEIEIKFGKSKKSLFT